MDKKIEEILLKDLKKELSEKRFNHTIKVCETARILADTYEVDGYKCQIGALAHDFTKEWNEDKSSEIMSKHFKDEEVMNIKPAWHGYTASVVLKEKYGIEDESILDAVKYHTLGHPSMDNIAKVVYIADFIEPTRKKNNVEYFLNLVGMISLDKLLYEVMKYNIDYLNEVKKEIPKQTLELYEKLK